MPIYYAMRIQSATFRGSAVDLQTCPEPDLPEVAFIGRSNVGKSSLLNYLTGQSGLAKVSQVPGKTRMINFFEINEAFQLVDLPGYGYAKVSREERSTFSSAVADYLFRRESLLRILVLIDSRLSPQAIDLEFLEWLVSHSLPFALVFTKIDKLKPREVARNMETFQQRISSFCAIPPLAFASSSEKRQGRAEILGFIQDALNAASE